MTVNSNESVNLWMQVYDLAVDQTTNRPSAKQMLPTTLPPADCELRIKIRDKISGQASKKIHNFHDYSIEKMVGSIVDSIQA